MPRETYQGRPCRNGHSGVRYVRRDRCIECDKAQEVKRQQKHGKKRYLHVLAWVKRNRPKANEYRRKWEEKNPEARRIRDAQRAAWKRGAGGRGVTAQDWRHVLSLSCGLCPYCGEPSKLTLDHIEPLSRGGLHDPNNIIAVCGPCNYTKQALPLILWMAKRKKQTTSKETS